VPGATELTRNRASRSQEWVPFVVPSDVFSCLDRSPSDVANMARPGGTAGGGCEGRAGVPPASIRPSLFSCPHSEPRLQGGKAFFLALWGCAATRSREDGGGAAAVRGLIPARPSGTRNPRMPAETARGLPQGRHGLTGRCASRGCPAEGPWGPPWARGPGRSSLLLRSGRLPQVTPARIAVRRWRRGFEAPAIRGHGGGPFKVDGSRAIRPGRGATLAECPVVAGVQGR